MSLNTLQIIFDIILAIAVMRFTLNTALQQHPLRTIAETNDFALIGLLVTIAYLFLSFGKHLSS